MSNSPQNNIPKENNFNILRFFLALTVVVAHALVLSNNDGFIIDSLFNSTLAVQCFFVISGFLIFMSYDKRKDIRLYTIKRFRRVYPAYFTVIILACLFGLFLTSYDIKEYLSFDLLKYLFFNMIFMNFLQPSLPGVFESNPMQAINGSLWTIKVEVMLYISVPIIVHLFDKYKQKKKLLIIIIYFLSVLFNLIFNYLGDIKNQDLYHEIAKQLPGQMSFFISGAICYYYFSYFKNKIWIYFPLASLLYLMSLFFSIFESLKPFAIALLLMYLVFERPIFSSFGKNIDLSYGIYIFHFPVIQTLIHFNVFDINFGIGLIVSVLCTLSLAYFSWICIERPVLKGDFSFYKKMFLTKKEERLQSSNEKSH